MGRGVGTYFGHAFHLDDKCYRTVVTLLRRLCQLVQVLDAAQGRGIREIADAVHFQRTAFHFQQVLFFAFFHVEVNAGAAVGILRPHQVIPFRLQPLLHHLVGGLAVDVDPPQAGLVHCHQIIFGFAVRVIANFQPHIRTGQQQFFAAPGVFYVDGLHRIVYLHLRNKAVGPAHKLTADDRVIFQSKTSFMISIMSHIQHPL